MDGLEDPLFNTMGSAVSAATQTQSGFQCLRVVGRLYLLLSEERGSPRSEARRTVAVMASWARSGQRRGVSKHVF